MTSDGKILYGRGGAGNFASKSKVSPNLEPTTTPTLKSQTYTTGRGGSGNMARNDLQHPEEARRAQDVDVPGIVLPEGAHHTGRGGAANMYQPTDEELRQNKANNEKVRTASFRREGDKERSTIRALAEKAKETLSSK